VARLTKDSVIGARYQVVRLLGAGGMGSVYEAIDAQTGARVAVKVITAEAAASETLMSRFAREAEAAAAIDTPHIVRVYGAGRDEERRLPFLVMEYLEGEDLHQLIKRLGPLPPDLALRIAAQACVGLQRAHDKRIVHRDIKPANFFLAQTEGGQRVVKLLDFGVAKIKADPTMNTAETAGLTRTGSMLGSPLYMSPEQARGHRDLDQRTDIWSFGVVLYQALCGHTPHRDTDLLGELLILICTEAPEPLQQAAPWIAPELASLVHRALRFNAGERFQTAGEMGLAISGLLQGDTSIDESMLVPIEQDMRGSVAPLVTASLHDAPAPRRTLGSSVAETRTISTTDGARSIPGVVAPPPAPSFPGGAPASGSVTSAGPFGTTVGRVGEGAMLAATLAPATRSPSPLLIGMAGLALLVAGATAAYVLARPAPAITVTTAEPSNSAAPAAPIKTRTVRLVVIPADATVELEGAPVTPKDGLVEIRGALGSVHAVHVKAGDAEASTDVVVTEDGALPPKIELHPTPVKAIPGRPAPTVKSVPGPLPTAKPSTPQVPSDFRTGR
jgi:eukaryotic-like serine/threonine-protein kinase